MATVEYRRMQQIRGSAAEFEAINPILLDGELAIEQTHRILKAGTADRRPWNELEEFTVSWSNLRNVPEGAGQQGPKGDDGKDGKSAYQSYVDAFNEEHKDDVVDEEHPAAEPLSEDEWIASLKGETGETGESAFEAAQRLGLATGTEADWLNSLKGEKGEQGNPFQVKKIFSSVDEMAESDANVITPAVPPTEAQGEEGDLDYVPATEGTPAVLLDPGDFVMVVTDDQEEEDNGKLYVYEGEVEGLITFKFIVDMSVASTIAGPQGEKGDTGETGMSAYQSYVKVFNEAHEEDDPKPLPLTEAEWVASLQGRDGVDGETNYEIYKRLQEEAGEEALSEAEWLLTVKGEPGDSAYQIALDEGYVGSKTEWLASLRGRDGKNATVTILEGNTVVERVDADGVAITGADGRSAYQVAVERGFVGTVDEWLDSLQGEPGVMGPEGPQGEKGEKGDTGPAIAGFAIKKVFSTEAEMGEDDAFLDADGKSLAEGDFVLLAGTVPAESAEEEATLYGVIYIVDSVTEEGYSQLSFREIGNLGMATQIQGPKGEKGDKGDSAYQDYLAQFAVDHAEDVVDEEHPAAEPLTRDAWLTSLKGEKGDTGSAGPSAFAIAQALGFEGTQVEWIASLKGDEGKSAYDMYVETVPPNETPMTEDEWLDSLHGQDGKDGKSAYQSYVDAFNEEHKDDVVDEEHPAAEPLSEDEWIASLSGKDGKDGESVVLLQKQLVRTSVIIQNYKAALEYLAMETGVELPDGLMPTDDDIISYDFDEEDDNPDENGGN